MLRKSPDWLAMSPVAVDTASRRLTDVHSRLKFTSIGHEVWFSYYLSSVIAIALVVSITMRDTRRYSELDRHD